MADDAEKTDADDESEGAEKAAKKGGSPLPYLIVGILGTALGLAVPFLIPQAEAPAEDSPEIVEKDAYVGDDVTKVDVEFEDKSTVQNLSGDRLNRFLSVKLNLVVAEDSEEDVKTALDKKKVQMKNWLIGQIADKTLEDVSGKAGQNRLRREIRDQFNSILFPDGGDRIFDIYFTEFAVQ